MHRAAALRSPNPAPTSWWAMLALLAQRIIFPLFSIRTTLGEDSAIAGAGRGMVAARSLELCSIRSMGAPFGPLTELADDAEPMHLLRQALHSGLGLRPRMISLWPMAMSPRTVIRSKSRRSRYEAGKRQERERRAHSQPTRPPHLRTRVEGRRTPNAGVRVPSP